MEQARAATQTRGEQVKAIEADLLRAYADPTLASKPELLKQRGGGGYSEVATAAMISLYHNRGDRQYINTLNCGAIASLPAEAVVEMACVVDQTGARPIIYGDLPPAARGLASAVKAYEQLTVRAAATGDYRLALQALVVHPLVSSYDIAAPLLDELLAANRAYLPQFGR